MRDKELILEVLGQIEDAAGRIVSRFESIHSISDFTDSQAGVERMDAICMRLVVIGESLKNLDKITSGELLRQHPAVEWKKAMGMRDILSHHYADIDAEAVFYTCKGKIPLLHEAIRQMMEELA